MRSVEFIINAVPVAEGRARAYRAGGFIRVVTPEKTRAYRQFVAEAARAAMSQQEPLQSPLALSVTFWMPIPASACKRARAGLAGKPHIKKPDIDNLLKALMDGLTGVVFHDDSQVVSVLAYKRFGDPCTMVKLSEVIE